MQPSQEPAGSVQEPPASIVAEETKARRGKPRRGVRLWVAVVVGVVALLGFGGAGIAVLLYDRETKIVRETPDQVASTFLRAYLGKDQEDRALLYTCTAKPNLTELARLRAEMTSREATYGTTVTASWESLTVTGPEPDRKTVAVELVIAGSADGQQISSRSEPWSFDLVNESDGWRVCGAHKEL